MKRILPVFVSLGLLCVSSSAQSTFSGTWTYSPPSQLTYGVSIDPPVKADGSSVWSQNSTIAINYDATESSQAGVFESLLSAQGTGTYPEYSNLVFTPASGVSFSDITTLSAGYTFTTGTCHGGSMRWSIGFTDGTTIFVYYGKDSTFWIDCSSNANDPTIDQSGLNMINANFDGTGGDNRYETSDHPGTYRSYSDALSFASGKTVSYLALVLDGGWGGDQVVSLGSVMVNNNTFSPPASSTTTICPTLPATIQVFMVGASGGLTIDQSLDSTLPDAGNQFRIVSCGYQYLISGKSLGPGTFEVGAIINGQPAPGSGTKFSLK